MSDLPAAYLRDVVELVKRWRVSPEELLAGLPLSPAALADPATRVPIVVCGEIVARAHRMTGEPALALYLGMQMRLSSHGFLGFAAMTSGTLAEAIALAVRFASTRTDLLSLEHYVEGDEASLVFTPGARLPARGPFHEFVVIALAVGLWQIAEVVTGKQLAASARLECTFAAPAYLAKLPLADRARFAAPVDRLVFPAALLGTPLVGADPIATQLARAECERELAAIAHAGLGERVRAAIDAAVVAERAPSLPAVAKALGVSPRTLKRQLAARPQGATTFSELVADVRRQRALLLLGNPALSIGEVAHKLGYTELPNFTRAFRRWTGVTPAAYRSRPPRARRASSR